MQIRREELISQLQAWWKKLENHWAGHLGDWSNTELLERGVNLSSEFDTLDDRETFDWIIEVIQKTDWNDESWEKQCQDFIARFGIEEDVAQVPNPVAPAEPQEAKIDLGDPLPEGQTNHTDPSSDPKESLGEANEPETGGSAPEIELMTPEVLGYFFAEAREHLDLSETVFLDLSQGQHDQEKLNSAFRAIHSFKGNCGLFNFPELESVTHQFENVLDAYREQQASFSTMILSDFLSVVDLLRKNLKAAEEKSAIHFDQSVLDRIFEGAMLELEQRKVIDEDQSPVEADSDEEVAEIQTSEPIRQAWVKVKQDRLDEMLELIGELSLAFFSLDFWIQSHDALVEGKRPTEDLGRIIRECHASAMDMMLVPLDSLFQRLRRAAFDQAKKGGKSLQCVFYGSDIRVDKNIQEKILSPLVHLVRNAVDHGIEAKDERRALSKPEKATITIRAENLHGVFHLSVRDDGRGIDPQKIEKRALEKMLIQKPVSTPEEAYQLMFMPGFSTKSVVTEISGRGVGLDVVKNAAVELRGKVDVHSSLGKGSEFTLMVPQSLALEEGWIVAVGHHHFFIPIHFVDHAFSFTSDMIHHAPNGVWIREGNVLLPTLDARDILGVAGEQPPNLAVVLQLGARPCVLLINAILDHLHLPVKPLPLGLPQTAAFSGVSVLGNGEICFVLDLLYLVQQHLSFDPQPLANS